MPNHLGYCGGGHSEVLLEHAALGRPDARLAPLLARFSGAFPYLRTIAGANGIADPFDARVVEAYWLGNDLLERVEAAELNRSLEERFGRQLTGRVREEVLRKPVEGARPFHLFHVLDVYTRLESAEVGMAATDSCRISWGRVKGIDGAAVLVERQPLEWSGGKLALGAERSERALRQLSGLGFAEDLKVGDWVSLHWGWVCEVLDQRRLANLRRWSARHVELANRTPPAWAV